MRKIAIVILIFVGSVFFYNNGPVWFQRLFGYDWHVDKVFYPQWINNEEYCYLRVINYYKAYSGWSGLYRWMNPYYSGPNATFYIYKVNINQPDKKKLVRKINAKVDFWISPDWPKLQYGGEEFTFRRLDNGELVLLIRGRKEYIAYYINANGKILRKRVFDYYYLDGKSIVDISLNGSKLLMKKYNDLYIKNISTKKKYLFYKDTLQQRGRAKWIFKNRLVEYKGSSLNKEKNWKDIRCEVYFLADKQENIELVYSSIFKDYDEFEFLSLDAAFLPDSNFLFLSKIGIFKKQDGKWQMIKDLKDMEFNFFYPDWSPDGKRLVGVLDSKNLKVIEVKDLLGD